MKAADIPDELMLEAVVLARISPLFTVTIAGDVTRWLTDRLGVDVPHKVTLAKARTLIRQGRMNGCACGCSGGWSVP